MNKLTPEDLTKQKVIPDEDLPDRLCENDHLLLKQTRGLDGQMHTQKHIGSLIININEVTGDLIPDRIRNGWMIGTARHLSTKINSAVPHAENRTWVAHQKNRCTWDQNNTSELVLLPPDLLSALYKFGSGEARFSKLFGDAVENFLENVLVKNGFLPENMKEKHNLHSALEESAKEIVLPREGEHGYEKFHARGPFANIRQEIVDPNTQLGDAFDSKLINNETGGANNGSGIVLPK